MNPLHDAELVVRDTSTVSSVQTPLLVEGDTAAAAERAIVVGDSLILEERRFATLRDSHGRGDLSNVGAFLGVVEPARGSDQSLIPSASIGSGVGENQPHVNHHFAITRVYRQRAALAYSVQEHHCTFEHSVLPVQVLQAIGQHED